MPGPSMCILPLTTTWRVEGGTLISSSRQRGKLRLREVKSSGKGHTDSHELSLQWNHLHLVPEAKLFNHHPQSPTLLNTQMGTRRAHGQLPGAVVGLVSWLPGGSLASSVWGGLGSALCFLLGNTRPGKEYKQERAGVTLQGPGLPAPAPHTHTYTPTPNTVSTALPGSVQK